MLENPQTNKQTDRGFEKDIYYSDMVHVYSLVYDIEPQCLLQPTESRDRLRVAWFVMVQACGYEDEWSRTIAQLPWGITFLFQIFVSHASYIRRIVCQYYTRRRNCMRNYHQSLAKVSCRTYLDTSGKRRANWHSRLYISIVNDTPSNPV